MRGRMLVLLVGVLAIAFGQPGSGRAQDRLLTATPLIASPDIAFRITRFDGQIPVGELVVRVNGVWVTPEIAK